MTEPAAPDELLQFRIRVPNGWEESLQWWLSAQGWGPAIVEQYFPAGHLDDEPVVDRVVAEVVLVVPVQRGSELQAALGAVAQQWEWKVDQWTVQTTVQTVENWEQAWRKRWRAFRCAGFVVHADFHLPLEMRPSDLPLRLVTGSAFGTGGHPSTRIGLRVVRRWATLRPAAAWLDVGTGSGILATAAALLGAQQVVGMDPDPPSPAQARATAEVNQVGDRCRFWLGSLESAGGNFDLVLANLQSGLLQRCAGDLWARCRPGGGLFAGGFMERNEAPTLAALHAVGFQLERLHRHGHWRAGEWIRPQDLDSKAAL